MPLAFRLFTLSIICLSFTACSNSRMANTTTKIARFFGSKNGDDKTTSNRKPSVVTNEDGKDDDSSEPVNGKNPLAPEDMTTSGPGGGGESVIGAPLLDPFVKSPWQSKEDNQKLSNFYASKKLLREGDWAFHSVAGKTPLSFSSPNLSYWAEYICGLPSDKTSCAVESTWFGDPINAIAGSGLEMPDSTSAKKSSQYQLERVLVQYGANIYDAATWQVALGLASKVGLMEHTEAEMLINHQHDRLAKLEGRAEAARFYYGESELNRIENPQYSYSLRSYGPSWKMKDPFFTKAEFKSLLSSTGGDIEPGDTSWPDWKPITGENGWGLLLGPLQAVMLLHDYSPKKVPFDDIAVQNAMHYIWALRPMQSQLGAFYYAANGSVGNEGQALGGLEISLENNFSVLGGLAVLKRILLGIRSTDKLAAIDQERLDSTVNMINIMLYGGKNTDGLLIFLKEKAYDATAKTFYQGGTITGRVYKDNTQFPKEDNFAVDVNTWGVASIGPKTVDEWYGPGTSYYLWQTVKKQGSYQSIKKDNAFVQDGIVRGVGYSENEKDQVLSGEWTFGAMNMVEVLIDYYTKNPLPDIVNLAELQKEKKSMEEFVLYLRTDNYKTKWSELVDGVPPKYQSDLEEDELGFLYASKRYFIPFGWFANPFVSTASSTWALMYAYQFNPFSAWGSFASVYFDLGKKPNYDKDQIDIVYDKSKLTIINDVRNTDALHESFVTVSAHFDSGNTEEVAVIKPGSFVRVKIPKDAVKIGASYQPPGTDKWLGACTLDLDQTSRKRIEGDPRDEFMTVLWTNESGSGPCRLGAKAKT